MSTKRTNTKKGGKKKVLLSLQKECYLCFQSFKPIISSFRQAEQHLYSHHSPDYWSPEHISLNKPHKVMSVVFSHSINFIPNEKIKNHYVNF